MRAARIVGAGVILASMIAGWVWLTAIPRSGKSQASPPSLTTHPEMTSGTAAGQRIFLSKAQRDDARASGMLDKPVKSLLLVPKMLQYGDYVWNEQAIPSGQTWIRIDLHTQLISVFRSGNEIGTALIVYGGDNKETPTGTLHILGKMEKHRSSLYEAEMPYTLRLTDDGVSIHASSVRWGAATHGCIGVPLSFARKLFEVASVGDEVVIVPDRRRQL